MRFYVIRDDGFYLTSVGGWSVDNRHAASFGADAVMPILWTLFTFGVMCFAIRIDLQLQRQRDSFFKRLFKAAAA